MAVWFDDDVDEHLRSVGEFDHSPIAPARESHVGENVYSFQWLQLHVNARTAPEKPPNSGLYIILRGVNKFITQRHASVAASAITYLGCNAGKSIISRADKLKTAGMAAEEAFICAWAIMTHSFESQTELYGSICSSASDWGQDFGGFTRLVRLPEVSEEDRKTIQHTFAWCGTNSGQKFIRLCEAMIENRSRMKPKETITAIIAAKSRTT